jgi:hypothetical protein
VRATGAEGGLDNVRPTLSFPAPPVTLNMTEEGAVAIPSAGQDPESAERRGEWFREQLIELGRADMPTANRRQAFARSLLQGADGSVNFNLPFNAAAIELAVPYNHEFTFTGSATAVVYGEIVQPCGWEHATNTAWCAGTDYYAQAGGNPIDACERFLADGLQVVESSLLPQFAARGEAKESPPGSGLWDTTGVPRFDKGHLDQSQVGFAALNQNPAGMDHGPTHCPKPDATQTGRIQGNDYFYAIFDPGLKQHTLIALTDSTINASDTGNLALDQTVNGTYRELIEELGHDDHDRQLKETMLFLGAYVHEMVVTGAHLGDTNLEYSGNKSFPNQQITFTEQTKSTAKSQSFSVGVFGDMATGSYASSVSESASVSMSVPSWEIVPTPGDRKVTYTWTTNDPVTWDTITSNDMTNFTAGAPEHHVSTSWELNPLNKVDFSPTSLTVWTGAQTYGQLSISSQRTLRLVDHFSYFSPTRQGPKEAFWISTVTFSDSPDAVTPNTKDPAGSGINLCDPLVRAPDFKTADACGN